MEGGNSLHITCSSGVPRTLRLPALSVDLRRTLAVACWDGVAAVSLVQVGIDFRIGEFFLSCASEKRGLNREVTVVKFASKDLFCAEILQ